MTHMVAQLLRAGSTVVHEGAGHELFADLDRVLGVPVLPAPLLCHTLVRVVSPCVVAVSVGEGDERESLAVVRDGLLEVDEAGHGTSASLHLLGGVLVTVGAVVAKARAEHGDDRSGHSTSSASPSPRDASRSDSFQVRKRWWTRPSGPRPSPVPSANRRKVHVSSRSSAAIAR